MPTTIKTVFQALFDPHDFAWKNNYTRAVASKIHSCHTAVQGYHCYQCSNQDCGHTQLQYHSCGNRHCTFCGTLKKVIIRFLVNKTGKTIVITLLKFQKTNVLNKGYITVQLREQM